MSISYVRIISNVGSVHAMSITVNENNLIVFYNIFHKTFYGFLADGTRFSSIDSRRTAVVNELKQFFKD